MAIETTGRPTLDPAALRADFPILRREINGRPLVYLDSASSSQKPQVVIDAMTEYYEQHNANVHRGIYTIAEEATAAYEGARVAAARFINAPDSHELVFTRNATEAINLVAYAWGRRNVGRGDQIILTEMEHHANLVPWQLLVQEVDGDLEFIPITDDGAPAPGCLRGAPAPQAQARRLHPCQQHAGHHQPGPRAGRHGPRGGSARARRWGAGRAPRPGRCPGPGLRLLCVQRPQDAGAHGLRCAVGSARAARGDASVPGRRRHDPRGPPAAQRIQRDPLQVRGGHTGRR